MTSEDRTRETYNRMAERYHAKRLDPAENQWNILLEEPAMERLLRPVCAGKQVLDLGCGTGMLTTKLLDWGASVCGMDPAERMVALAQSLQPSVEFRVAATASIPYEDNVFDIVASSLVLHYIQDLAPVFLEVRRVLLPRGYFTFSMHHPIEDTLTRDHEGRVLAKSYFHNEPYTWEMCEEQLISYHHTMSDVINGLGSAGFQVSAIDECMPAPESQAVFSAYDYTSQHPCFCVFKAQLAG